MFKLPFFESLYKFTPETHLKYWAGLIQNPTPARTLTAIFYYFLNPKAISFPVDGHLYSTQPPNK